MATSAAFRASNLVRLGLSPDRWDVLVALAGNPNVGKSTVFNALTGLRQHTGNWPGKTVVRAEGAFAHGDKRVKIVDLPGTYSLQAGSVDEEVARDFVQRIHREVDRMIVLTDDILQLFRLESGHAQMAMAPVDMKALVQDVLAQFD